MDLVSQAESVYLPLIFYIQRKKPAGLCSVPPSDTHWAFCLPKNKQKMVLETGVQLLWALIIMF